MATNLEFIKSATGTSVSSLSVTDCFSAKYDVYYVSVTDNESTNSIYNYVRLIDSGGSVISASEYENATFAMVNYTTFTEFRGTSSTVFSNLNFQDSGTTGTGIGMYIFNPYDSSSYTFTTSQSSTKISAGLFGAKAIGVHKSAEQITGINFFPFSTGTYNNITINVFGVK